MGGITPVRECVLKYCLQDFEGKDGNHSRKGVCIEILLPSENHFVFESLP